jgi:signal transduction histidine kinase
MPDMEDKKARIKGGAASVTPIKPTIPASSIEADNSTGVAFDRALRDLQIQSNQLYRAANELQRTNQFQSMILDSINQGIVVVDEFSQLVAWNDEFLRLYGLGKTLLHKGMGLPDFSELFAISKNSGPQSKLLSFNDRLGSLKSGEYLDVLADGTAIEIKVSTRDSGGLIATYTDVTSHIGTEARLREQRTQLKQQVAQLQTLGHSLEEARSQAVKSDQQKSRFLAMISHDIRTPMSALISSLELFSADEDQADQERLRQVALASGRQMLFLLSEIIEVSRSEGWNFTIEKEDVAISDLLASIVAAWHPFAARKSVKLDLVIAETIPYSVQTDPKRLRQVVDNLLSNAIKFTDAGTVMVHVDLVASPDGDLMRIRVKDSGRGISNDMQHKLFQEFGRFESANASPVEGTGLGLSICKRIVESMNGSIGAESVAGTGSVFWIKLPLVRGMLAAEEARTASPECPAIPKEARSLRILIADDDEMNRIVLSTLLKRLGCSSKLAVDGQQAFDLLQAEDFDVVLMDNYMPIANGAEVTRWIRALTTSKKSIPIIGITASEARDEHAELLQAGMTAVYKKPLSSADLMTILSIFTQN